MLIFSSSSGVTRFLSISRSSEATDGRIGCSAKANDRDVRSAIPSSRQLGQAQLVNGRAIFVGIHQTIVIGHLGHSLILLV